MRCGYIPDLVELLITSILDFRIWILDLKTASFQNPRSKFAVYSAANGTNPASLDFLMVLMTSRWCLAQQPLIRLGIIFPLSVI
jgi:hypothetical protein